MTLTGAITDDQARPLAALVAALRPGWDIQGIRVALHQARHRAPAHELAIAAIRCTLGDARTPAVIAMDGPHWHTPGQPARDDHRFARCEQPGHGSFPAWNCSACRAENLEADPADAVPDPNRPDPAATLAGAALVRTAMREHGIPTTDRSAP